MKIKYSLFVVSILCVITSNYATADVPLLDANGKQQECESFNRWIKKAQELGGDDVTGAHIQSQHFVKRIAPAFADSIFSPLIGKPYAKLSDREKQSILKILQRCKGKAPSFLPLAFEFSKRSNTSTARDLQVAIQNVTQADVKKAQNNADRRAAQIRIYEENRPTRTAHVLPGDPNAIKRQRLTDQICNVDQSGFRFLYNDYVYHSKKGVVPYINERGHGHDQPCREMVAMQKFVPGVKSLIRGGSGGISSRTLLSIGDICAPNPKILFLSYNLKVDLPKYDAFLNLVDVRRGSPYLGSLPYEFYVPTGSDGVVYKGIINSVEQGLLATRKIVMNQCQTVPDRIQVVAGTLIKEAGRFVSRNRYNPEPKNLEYWQYYSGTFFPNAPEKRLVHDDLRLAETFAKFADSRKKYTVTDEERERRKREAFTVVGFFALAVIATFESIDPCNDININYQTRKDAGCFDP